MSYLGLQQGVPPRKKTDPAPVAKPRKTSGIRKGLGQIPSTIQKGSRDIASVVLGADTGSASIDQLTNVLNLVEVLMKEVQALKNSSRESKKEIETLTDFIAKQEQSFRTEIARVSKALADEQSQRLHIQRETSNLLKKLASPSRPDVKTSTISLAELISLQELLENDTTQLFSSSEDFTQLISFSEFKATKTEEEQEEEPISEPSFDEIDIEQTKEGAIQHEVNLNEIPCEVLTEPQVVGFKVENGFSTYSDRQNEDTSIAIIESEKDIPFYRIYFRSKPHTNYIIDDPEKGIIVVSIATGEEVFSKEYGVIIRTTNGTTVLPCKSKGRKKKVFQSLNLNPNAVIKEIRDVNFQESLQVMEQKDIQIRTRYKFAVLYAKEGQSENEMFSNVQGSERWEEFLTWLGDPVELNGWKSYAGGLDTKTDTTGKYSIFAQHKGVEIMFHVSTMIPCSESDEIQIERKRHLGNDVVVIVFKEGHQPFSPKIIRSHFNCIFVVIQHVEVPNTTDTYYQMSVCSRDGIAPFPPYVKTPPIYKKDADFRAFLITKMINGERQAQYAPEFVDRIAKAKSGALKLLAKEFLKEKK